MLQTTNQISMTRMTSIAVGFMTPFWDPQNDTAQETPQQSPREC